MTGEGRPTIAPIRAKAARAGHAVARARMPNNGLVFAADALEYRLKGSATYSGSGAGDPSHSFGGTAATSYVPDATNVAGGIGLDISSSFDGTTGSWSARYDGPGADPLSGYVVSGSGYVDSLEISCVMRDLKIYQKLTGALFRIVWSAVDIYINSAFNATLPGSSVDSESAGCGPNYIPIIGMPLAISGGVTASRAGVPAFVWDACDPGTFPDRNWSASNSGTITGGWRFKDVGSSEWITDLPVSIWSGSEVPESGGSCPFGLALGEALQGADIWDCSIPCESSASFAFSYEGRESGAGKGWVDVTCTGLDETVAVTRYEQDLQCIDPCDSVQKVTYRDIYKTATTSASSGGSITALPNLEKGIHRLADDYRAIWQRFDLPEVKARALRHCSIDGVAITTAEDDVVYQATAGDFLGVITDDTHPMEDKLELPTYSPFSRTASKSEDVVHSTFGPSTCICGQPDGYDPSSCSGTVAYTCGVDWDALPDDSAKAENVSISFPYSVGTITGNYQDHAVPLARFFATWGNIGWHYVHSRENWSSVGLGYWDAVHQQHSSNAALPPEEETNQRNDLIASCWSASGHTPFMDSFMGGQRWGGVSRFQVRQPAIPDSLMIDESSPGRFAFFDDGAAPATGSVSGAGIAFDVDTVRCEIDLLDFASAPYLYALICDRLRFDSAGWTNVDSVAVSLVDYEDNAVVIGQAKGGEDWPIIRGGASEYAGSWGIDNGAGVLSDLGSDSEPEGVSAATALDPERIAALGLIPGATGKLLRIDITPTDPLLAAVVPFPELKRSETAPVMVWESSQAAALLYEDRSMIRMGNWVWYVPGLGFQNPPLISGAYKSTMLDALATQRVIFEGRDAEDDLTDELSQRWDSYEGQSYGIVDKFSISWPVPDQPELHRHALVNSMNECPPLTLFPTRKYDRDSWAKSAGFWAGVYDWCQSKRYLVNSHGTPHLFDGAAKISTAIDPPQIGWRASCHAIGVDNSETSNFTLEVDGTEYAEISPYRGFTMLLNILPPGGAHLTRMDAEGMIVATTASTDGVHLIRFMRNGLYEIAHLLDTDSAQSAQSAWHPSGHLLTIIHRDDDGEYSQLWRTGNYGATAELDSVFDDLESPAIAIDPLSGIEYVAGHKSGSWRCYRRTAIGESWEDLGAIVAAATAYPAGLEVAAEGDSRLIFIAQIGSDLARYESYDQGDSWAVATPS